MQGPGAFCIVPNTAQRQRHCRVRRRGCRNLSAGEDKCFNRGPFGVESGVQLPLFLILQPVLNDQSAALYATMLIVSIFQAAYLMMLLVLELTADEA
ncbi:MAG: hypothetical protein HEP70_08285 [Rhodobiaceae bacterium]|nr:hypothetical protein [Rhodobiaceae bacterium]